MMYLYDSVCIASSVLLILVGSFLEDAPFLLVLAGLASIHYRLPRCLEGTPGKETRGMSYWVDFLLASLSFLSVLRWKRAERVRPLIFLSALLMGAGMLARRHGEDGYLLSFFLHGGGHILSSACCLCLLFCVFFLSRRM